MNNLIPKFSSDKWQEVENKTKLKVVNFANLHIIPYKKCINSKEKIKLKSFENIPVTSKNLFLKKFSLTDLLIPPKLQQTLIFTSTSGSTGDPYYFPRTYSIDYQYSIIVELFLKQSSYGFPKPTLVLVCFGMGVWIGGLITYQAFEIAARRSNLPISILTPGINKVEIFKALKKLSKYYDQTIIIGYPPFIKDIVDESWSNGIDLKKIKIRFIFAAEVFSEPFRNYLAKAVGIKNVCRDMMNIYGSADIGAMAIETGISTLLKKIIYNNKSVYKDFFNTENKMPTIAQYDPRYISFESLNGEILITGMNAIPLIRYAIGDHGYVFTYKQVRNILKKNNISLNKELIKNSILDSTYELPFICIFERSDFSTTIYGLQIYPEIIRESLLKPLLKKYVTGKFVMSTKFDKKHNQYLEIIVELKNKIPKSDRVTKIAQNIIFTHLTQKSSEYRELKSYLKERAIPVVILSDYGNPEYFKTGIKQKWVSS